MELVGNKSRKEKKSLKVLVGSKLTTEFVPLDLEEEIPTGFSLTHASQDACAINMDDTVVLTGDFHVSSMNA